MKHIKTARYWFNKDIISALFHRFRMVKGSTMVFMVLLLAGYIHA
jgi:hypothetical protein